MNLFGRKAPNGARLAGEVFAMRAAITVLLRALGEEHPLEGALRVMHGRCMKNGREGELPPELLAGFAETMDAFIAAASARE